MPSSGDIPDPGIELYYTIINFNQGGYNIQLMANVSFLIFNLGERLDRDPDHLQEKKER